MCAMNLSPGTLLILQRELETNPGFKDYLNEMLRDPDPAKRIFIEMQKMKVNVIDPNIFDKDESADQWKWSRSIVRPIASGISGMGDLGWGFDTMTTSLVKAGAAVSASGGKSTGTTPKYTVTPPKYTVTGPKYTVTPPKYTVKNTTLTPEDIAIMQTDTQPKYTPAKQSTNKDTSFITAAFTAAAAKKNPEAKTDTSWITESFKQPPKKIDQPVVETPKTAPPGVYSWMGTKPADRAEFRKRREEVANDARRIGIPNGSITSEQTEAVVNGEKTFDEVFVLPSKLTPGVINRISNEEVDYQDEQATKISDAAAEVLGIMPMKQRGQSQINSGTNYSRQKGYSGSNTTLLIGGGIAAAVLAILAMRKK